MNALAQTNPMLDVPPQMVMAIAAGIEEPALIAEHHGFDEPQWEALKVFEPFVKLIDAKKAELKASGYSFRMKCGFISEMMLDDLYRRATSEDASFSAMLDFAKWTSKAAGLDAPKQDAANTGSTFSINIVLGGQSVQINARAQPNVIGAEYVEDVSRMPEFDFKNIPDYLESAEALHI